MEYTNLLELCDSLALGAAPDSIFAGDVAAVRQAIVARDLDHAAYLVASRCAFIPLAIAIDAAGGKAVVVDAAQEAAKAAARAAAAEKARVDQEISAAYEAARRKAFEDALDWLREQVVPPCGPRWATADRLIHSVIHTTPLPRDYSRSSALIRLWLCGDMAHRRDAFWVLGLLDEYYAPVLKTGRFSDPWGRLVEVVQEFLLFRAEAEREADALDARLDDLRRSLVWDEDRREHVWT